MFNLVFESNVASCRLWDALGFDRIGRVKDAGRLRGKDGKDTYVDSIMYGKQFVSS